MAAGRIKCPRLMLGVLSRTYGFVVSPSGSCCLAGLVTFVLGQQLVNVAEILPNRYQARPHVLCTWLDSKASLDHFDP